MADKKKFQRSFKIISVSHQRSIPSPDYSSPVLLFTITFHTFEYQFLSSILTSLWCALVCCHSSISPEREICLRFAAMAAVRTKDRKKNSKNSAKTRRDSELQRNKDAAESSKRTWSFCSSKGNSSYKDLGVAELHWPAEDERELSQEIVRVNPLSRHSILQVNKHWMNECLERTYP